MVDSWDILKLIPLGILSLGKILLDKYNEPKLILDKNETNIKTSNKEINFIDTTINNHWFVKKQTINFI